MQNTIILITEYEKQTQERLNNSLDYTAKSRSCAKKITRLLKSVEELEMDYSMKKNIISKLAFCHCNVLVKK